MRRFRNISWTTIILLCIFFTPVGVVLAILKDISTKDKTVRKRRKKRSNALKGWGWFVAILGAICTSSLVMEATYESLWVGILLVVVGIAMIVGAYLKEKQKRTYDMYLNIIGLQNITSLDSIRAIVKKDRKAVVEDLENMMKKGYFANCYIDYSKGIFVVPKVFTAPQRVSKRWSYAVKCPNCGANVVSYMGEVVRCEYCGTPL